MPELRIPDVDELGFATDLIKPQSGTHWDTGVKLAWRNLIDLSLTGFLIRIEDEIWFDALNYINTNYDRKTRRKGLEAELKVWPSDRFRFWVLYTFVDATFEGTDYKVPTVPRHKLSTESDGYSLTAGMVLVCNHVGERPQGRRPMAGTHYEPMPAYRTVDVKLSYRIPSLGLQCFASVSNAFDEQYYSLAYYDSVYPAPGRTFLAGAEFTY
jgi:outer membrane receptor protein involved in Fe transport